MRLLSESQPHGWDTAVTGARTLHQGIHAQECHFASYLRNVGARDLCALWRITRTQDNSRGRSSTHGSRCARRTARRRRRASPAGARVSSSKHSSVSRSRCSSVAAYRVPVISFDARRRGPTCKATVPPQRGQIGARTRPMINVMYELSAVLRQQQVMVLQGGVLALAIVRRHKAAGLGPPTKVGRQTSHVPRCRVLVTNQETKCWTVMLVAGSTGGSRMDDGR